MAPARGPVPQSWRSLEDLRLLTSHSGTPPWGDQQTLGPEQLPSTPSLHARGSADVSFPVAVTAHYTLWGEDQLRIAWAAILLLILSWTNKQSSERLNDTTKVKPIENADPGQGKVLPSTLHCCLASKVRIYLRYFLTAILLPNLVKNFPNSSL